MCRTWIYDPCRRSNRRSWTACVCKTVGERVQGQGIEPKQGKDAEPLGWCSKPGGCLWRYEIKTEPCRCHQGRWCDLLLYRDNSISFQEMGWWKQSRTNRLYWCQEFDRIHSIVHQEIHSDNISWSREIQSVPIHHPKCIWSIKV